jgi:hypothetical protein
LHRDQRNDSIYRAYSPLQRNFCGREKAQGGMAMTSSTEKQQQAAAYLDLWERNLSLLWLQRPPQPASGK